MVYESHDELHRIVAINLAGNIEFDNRLIISCLEIVLTLILIRERNRCEWRNALRTQRKQQQYSWASGRSDALEAVLACARGRGQTRKDCEGDDRIDLARSANNWDKGVDRWKD